MKTTFTTVSLLASLLVIIMPVVAYGQPVEMPPVQTPELPPVNVYETAMADYVMGGGSTTVMMKARSAAYVEALEVESKRMADEIRNKIRKCETLSTNFESMYALFKEFTRQAARFSDSANFFDYDTGEFYPGTAVGLTAMNVEATLLWQFITSCRLFATQEGMSAFSFPPIVAGQETSIGGYDPQKATQGRVAY